MDALKWCGVWLLAGTLAASAQGAVQRVRTSGVLRCAVDQGTPEWTTLDGHGNRVEFDLELCHAVAVAIAGEKATVLPVMEPDEAEVVKALLETKADLAPTVSVDLTHRTIAGLSVGDPALIDGIGLLTPVRTAAVRELSGRKVCFYAETETEGAVRAYFARHDLDLVAYPFSEEGEMEAALVSGNCAAEAGDWTRLAAVAAQVPAGRFHVLPEMLADDPLGPASADAGLVRVADWVVQVMLNAEALGVTRAGLAAAEKRAETDGAVARLLGRTHELGPKLGLDDMWPVRVLLAVGNYGELYQRTVGLRLPRTDEPTVLPLK